VHKTVHHRQDGFKGHVVIEPDTGLFTGAELTEAAGAANHEAVIGLDLLTQDPATAAGQDLEVLGDTAYGTGDARAVLDQAGHTPIIKPAPLRPAVEGGFTLDDFTVDEQAGTVTCPNGLTRRLTAKRTATFGAGCRGCPLREQCTTAKDGRTISLHPHDQILRAARAQWATDEQLRATYRAHRPMVERSIAWLIGPKGRCRKLRYHGTTANAWWLRTRIAGLNLRRLLNLGLTHQPTGWTLA
jgi:hypothetical protein